MLSRSWNLITKRAASATASTAASRVTAQESVTRLPNGLTVASVDLQGATSQLVIGFRAGSRYEKENEQGVIHLARNCVGKDSGRYPGTTLLWNTALTGGILDVKFRDGRHYKNSLLSKRFVSGEAVLVGVNIDHESLLNYATEQIPLNEGTATASPTSRYFGGEARKNFSGPSSYVALAGKGAALSDTKSVAVQSVLAEIFYAATKKITNSAQPININYQDAGLVGVQFNAANDGIGLLTKSVATSLKNVKLDKDTINAAKRKAMLKVLSASESASSVALDCAVQLLAGSSVTPSIFVDNINSLTQNEISKAMTDSLSKLSMAVYGSTYHVPYLDEL
uniref:Peptidase_M16 domain-containing protein n=1 Tax=Heterorhabditis bacteriophora TaxID=37862 RepID=A0A1I7WZL8_HETBA